MDELNAHRLRHVIAELMAQRDVAVSAGASFAAHLIDLAIMQLRATVHDISEDELFEFCDVLGDGEVSGKNPD